MKKSIDGQNMAQVGPVSHHSNSSGSADSEKVQKKEKELAPETILGLDFGKSKIGLALADTETRIAFAYGTLKNDVLFLDKLKQIIVKEGVAKIIIGKPFYLENNGNAREIEKFAEKIAQKTSLKVEFEEEMFTTKLAQENIKQTGRKNIAEIDDQESARIILQEWLDKLAP